MASAFRAALAEHRRDPGDRRWLYVPYDQLSDGIGPLARHAPREVGIVLVESEAKGRRRPYHKQKLALIIANQRQFALEQASRGVAVRYLHTAGTYADALREVARSTGPLTMMRAAERELRVELAGLIEEGLIEEIPHEGWLTTVEDFEGRPPVAQARRLHSENAAYRPRGPWRMDAFYRRVRTRLRILMEGKDPVGGRWSFDQDNREPWRGVPAPPTPPVFDHDVVTREVADLVEDRFSSHPGSVDLRHLPATLAHAEQLWAWALGHCLPHFGPYEDAMSRRDDGLFHTRVSALLNIHRLLPARLVRDVERLDAPLNSREGFIRQIIGWREYVRHVHEATDGFTRMPDGVVPRGADPGDGGFGRWRRHHTGIGSGESGIAEARHTEGRAEAANGEPGALPKAHGRMTKADSFGGAMVNVLDSRSPLPLAYWGAPSGLACLDHVVQGVWRDAWSHHIPRLMVLSNIAALLDTDPRELTDWFWVAYADAYDWVVEPNVLGMGTYAVGPLMTTKPYVAGAGYIARMSDYCESCAFDPKHSCPLTRLYWAYLARHEATFSRNQRMRVVMSALRKRSVAQRRQDEQRFEEVRERLIRGERIDQPSLWVD